jgi:hypothetical protein
MPEKSIALLRARAKRSFESGRLLSAARVGVVVVPLGAICARETGAYARCTVAAALLLTMTIVVRWRQWRGIRAVDAGLLTGIIPMAAALLLCRFPAGWPTEAALAVCAGAGFAAGMLAARSTLAALNPEWPEWASASLVAGLTAALGCVGIGFGTAIGAAIGVATGAVVATRLPRHV